MSIYETGEYIELSESHPRSYTPLSIVSGSVWKISGTNYRLDINPTTGMMEWYNNNDEVINAMSLNTGAYQLPILDAHPIDNPPAGYLWVYIYSGGWYKKDEAGTVAALAGGGGGGDMLGANNLSELTNTSVARTNLDFADNLAGTTNTTPFTPSADHHVATKKYVDDNAGGAGVTVGSEHLIPYSNDGVGGADFNYISNLRYETGGATNGLFVNNSFWLGDFNNATARAIKYVLDSVLADNSTIGDMNFMARDDSDAPASVIDYAQIRAIMERNDTALEDGSLIMRVTELGNGLKGYMSFNRRTLAKGVTANYGGNRVTSTRPFWVRGETITGLASPNAECWLEVSGTSAQSATDAIARFMANNGNAFIEIFDLDNNGSGKMRIKDTLELWDGTNAIAIKSGTIPGGGYSIILPVTAPTTGDFIQMGAAGQMTFISAIDASDIADGSVTNAEFQYLGSVTSDIQTQIDGKSATGHGHSNFSVGSAGFAPASGTPTGKFLKDDGTWATIGGGGDMLASTYDPAGHGQQLVGETATQTITNKTFDDDTTTLQDNLDNGKKAKFQLSGITTGFTRTLTVPDASTTIVGTDVAQTLTNKTIAAGSNTISGITNTHLSGSAAISNTNLNTMAGNTVKVNATASTATPTNLAIAASRVLGRDATGNLVSTQIKTAMIADGEVTLVKMAANSVDSDQYVDGSIDNVHLADDAVTVAKCNDDRNTEQIDIFIEEPETKKYTLRLKAMYAFDIIEIQYVAGAETGTNTLQVEINNGTPADVEWTGPLTTLDISTTSTNKTATGTNDTLNVGGNLHLDVVKGTTMTDLAVSIKIRRI